jgi:hypothetical protein
MINIAIHMTNKTFKGRAPSMLSILRTLLAAKRFHTNAFIHWNA